MINEHDLKDYEQMPFNPVTKPKHYMLFEKEGIEIRDVLKKLVDKLPTTTAPMFAADYVQAMQYGMRFMEKNGLEDLKKMRWYLDKLIEDYEQNKTDMVNTRCREFGCVYGTCLQPGESEQPCYCTQITGVPSKK